MVDKSTLGIIVVSSLVMLLTFKDLIQTSKSPAVELDVDGTNQNMDAISKNNNNNDFSDPSDDADFSNGGSSNDDDKFDDEQKLKSREEDQMEETDKFVKKLPSLKMKSNMQTIKFQFCYSCGYRNMFEQYSQLIKSRFPELKIVGENYAPQPYKIYIAQFLSSFKLLVIASVLFGVDPFSYVNMATPAFFTWATQNKLYACLMIFFISNAIETQLITTGAFEIYLNDIQIWSKLQSDRMPHEKELMQILDMNFNFEAQKKDAFGSNF